MTKSSKRSTVMTSSTCSSVKAPPHVSLPAVHACGLFLINRGQGTASLGVSVLPSVVEYLYGELDGISDLMSPVQPLLTQAVADNDQCKRNSKK